MHIIDHGLARPSAAAAALVFWLACAPSSSTAGFMATPPPPGHITTAVLARGRGKSSSIWELPQKASVCAPAQSRWLPVGGQGPCPSCCRHCENVEGLNVLGNAALPAELLCHRTGQITAEIDSSTDLGRILPFWLVYKAQCFSAGYWGDTANSQCGQLWPWGRKWKMWLTEGVWALWVQIGGCQCTATSWHVLGPCGMQPKTFAVIQRCYIRVREIVVAVIKGSQETLA